MSKWEYLIVLVDTGGLYKAVDEDGGWWSINALGVMGWELVAIDSTEEATTAWFKRPLEEASDE